MAATAAVTRARSFRRFVNLKEPSLTAITLRGAPAQTRKSTAHPSFYCDDVHGQRIWVFDHMTTGQVVHSLHPQIYAQLKSQLRFHGKKSVPPKFRKDLWDLMAIIELGPGNGKVGLSIYQKLREFRTMHELNCPEAWLSQPKAERTQQLMDQRANAIADFAAVLAGQGGGNLIMPHNRSDVKKINALSRMKTARSARELKTLPPVPPKNDPIAAAIHWRQQTDREFASAGWSSNVEHYDLPLNISDLEAKLHPFAQPDLMQPDLGPQP